MGSPPDAASTPMPRKVRLFLDFDGTITRKDVGDELFRTFGEFEPVHGELLRGLLTVTQYYRLSCQRLRTDATPERVMAFAQAQEVDANFAALVTWARSADIEVTVVSDGFDVYIRPILEDTGLADLDVRCNRLVHDNGTWTPSFPGASESCACFCASCKRNVLMESSGPDDIIVYVGDGRSDTCAADHADVVFAKGALAAHCVANGVAHHHFHTLFDVLQILRRRVETNDLRPRLQAERRRKQAFETE